MQKEFEQHARDMIEYLNRNGIQPKRPFATKLSIPAGYSIVKNGSMRDGRAMCTVLLPDLRLIGWSQGGGTWIPKPGRLFERQGFKAGDDCVSEEIIGYRFSVSLCEDGSVRSRVARCFSDNDEQLEMSAVFVDFAQRIIKNHR